MTAKPTKNYRELRVYQKAFEVAMRIFELEQYVLTDQARRASPSVCANIAEAWRKRRYPAHFASKLSDADTEAAATSTWVDFADACGYIEETEHAELRDTYDHICRKLTTMITRPETWCAPTRKMHRS